ncbi:glycoside hydrolase family 18 protein [Neorhodopirellula pilleata]|uniref:chitinase n=1 Tax=Neorhodopirellula pilleata TaxID=2714738 RepID=A0A5C6ARE7_9BACT|nr:glycoside hydrolase family 18 protein [Neorhodopirellula pilleata]TWU01636.1 Chitinase A1 precursor [Neorhodopirellula pilleata]
MRDVLAISLSALVIATAAPCSLQADDDRAFGGFRVAGYLPDYRFAELDVEPLHGLTDLIVFSAEPNVDGSLNLKRLENCPWEKLLAFKTKRRVRLFLTVGGWDRSTHFAQVAASQEKRKTFAAAVLRFALEKRLDGIDLDWEHPTDGPEQEAYGQLLADLRLASKPHGLMLTVTIAAWQRLPALAIHSVDGVQLMAYDHDKQHSTIDGTRKDVQTLIDAHIPAGKIVLGLPFYGRDVQSRQASTYGELVAKFAPDPKIDQIGQMYFNGPETIRRKVESAMDSRLAGVMVWELGQDAPGNQSLLKVIREAVSRSIK